MKLDKEHYVRNVERLEKREGAVFMLALIISVAAMPFFVLTAYFCFTNQTGIAIFSAMITILLTQFAIAGINEVHVSRIRERLIEIYIRIFIDSRFKPKKLR
jgi:hypothetical protein